MRRTWRMLGLLLAVLLVAATAGCASSGTDAASSASRTTVSTAPVTTTSSTVLPGPPPSVRSVLEETQGAGPVDDPVFLLWELCGGFLEVNPRLDTETPAARFHDLLGLDPGREFIADASDGGLLPVADAADRLTQAAVDAASSGVWVTPAVQRDRAYLERGCRAFSWDAPQAMFELFSRPA